MTPPAPALPRAAPWYLRAGAWIGIGTGPGALMMGGGLAEGRGWAEIVTVFVLGSALISALCVAHGWVGMRRGTVTVDLAEQAFGPSAGPRLVAALITVGVACWAGFYIGLIAGALGGVLDVTPPGVAVVLATVFWLVYRAGFRQWNAAVAVTGLLALAVGILALTGVPSSAGPQPVSGPAVGSLAAGIGSVVAYAAVFAVRVPDFTFDARRGREVSLPGLCLFATLVAFLVLGAAIQARSGSWDLAHLIARSATPQVGALLLILSVLAPSVGGLHSGAIGLARLLGWPSSRGATAVAVVAGLLGATRFDLLLLPFLAVLGAVMPPVVAVLMLQRDRGRRWHSWTAWAAGSMASLAALAAGLPMSVLLGIGIAAGCMLALTALGTGDRGTA